MSRPGRLEIEEEIRRQILLAEHKSLRDRQVHAGRVEALVWVLTGQPMTETCLGDLETVFRALGWPMPVELHIKLDSDSRSVGL